MLTASSSHSIKSESTNTIGHIVLKPPRAHIIQSKGDGFGAYVERLINVAYETHQSFPNLITTLNDLINYIREQLERSYCQYQFSIIIGKDFDYDQMSSHHSALIEHSGIKVLIFSSIGCSYKLTTTIIDDIHDDKKPLLW